MTNIPRPKNYNPDDNHRRPDKVFRTRAKGGRMGVALQVWANSNYEGKPRAVSKIDVGWRKHFTDEWKHKNTWNTDELETLYFIIREALEFCYAVEQGTWRRDE